MLKLILALYLTFEAFFWNVWVPGPHLAVCRPLNEIYYFIVDFIDRDSGDLCNAPGFFLFIVVCLIAYAINRARKLYKKRRQLKRERAEKLAEAENQRQRQSRALAIQQQEAVEQQRQENARQIELRKQRIIARAEQRLPEVERIFLMEWVHFKSQTDPYDERELDEVKREFGRVFIKNYRLDAPLLLASNDPKVRAVVNPSRTVWPQPNLD